MGILSGIKSLAPLSLYALGIAAFFAGLTGRVQWTLLLVTLLLPLRNVVEKLQMYPGGTQYLDLLFFSMILGWLFSSSEKKPLFDRSSLNGPAIFLILYTTFSLMYGSFSLTGVPSVDPGDPRVQDWKNFCLLPVLFFLTLNNIQDKTWMWRMFWVMCFSIMIMGYYTSTQITWFSSLTSRAKISGTFQFLGPNEVAAFINQCTIILMGVFFFMKRSRNKLLLLALILLNIYCIIFLYSRAAYIGLAIGMFVLFAFKKRLLLIPLILVGLLWQVVLPAKAIERIKETKNEYGELDESSERRIVMWEVGLQHFSESPIVGIGYGVFRHLGLDLEDTHNIYIKLMVEQGTIGLLIFFIVVFCFIYEGFQLYQKGEDDLSKGLGLGFMACMFTLMVNNFFGDRWAYFELSAYIWIFAGLVSRLNNLSWRNPPKAPAVNSTQEPGPSEGIKRKPKQSYYK
jgi:O-antigen ligase